MTLKGADEFDRALAMLEKDVADAQTTEAGAEIVERRAKKNSRSRRVRRTARIAATQGKAVIRFGSPRVPWTAPSHFGHGSPSRPRAQGGYMLRNPFLFDAVNQEEDSVVDVFVRDTNDAIRKAGLG